MGSVTKTSFFGVSKCFCGVWGSVPWGEAQAASAQLAELGVMSQMCVVGPFSVRRVVCSPSFIPILESQVWARLSKGQLESETFFNQVLVLPDQVGWFAAPMSDKNNVLGTCAVQGGQVCLHCFIHWLNTHHLCFLNGYELLWKGRWNFSAMAVKERPQTWLEKVIAQIFS